MCLAVPQPPHSSTHNPASNPPPILPFPQDYIKKGLVPHLIGPAVAAAIALIFLLSWLAWRLVKICCACCCACARGPQLQVRHEPVVNCWCSLHSSCQTAPAGLLVHPVQTTLCLPTHLWVLQGKKARKLLSGKGARWLKVLALLAPAGVLAGAVFGIVRVRSSATAH